MTIEPTTAYNLILPVGTQVVTRVEVKTSSGEVVYLRGAVGAIVQAPTDNCHAKDRGLNKV